MAMTLVSSVTIGSGGATQIEFANIPQTGKDLLLFLNLRDTAGQDTMQIRFNDSTSSYQYRWVRNSGSTGATSSTASQNYLDSTINPSSYTASVFSNVQIYIPNYTVSSDKVLNWDTVTENSATSFLHALGHMTWSNTSAISNLKLVHFTTNGIAQHSLASLYIVS